MPSFRHEAILELFRARPRLLVEILGAAGRLPLSDAPFTVSEASATDALPAERRADLVVVQGPVEGPTAAFVVEAQLAVDAEKRWSWPCYVTTLRARHRCPTCLVVVALTPDVARWAAAPIELGQPECVFVPLVMGPEAVPAVTDPAVAIANPELAVLSAMAHAHEVAGEVIARAAVAGIAALDSERVTLYSDIVFASLSAAAHRALEAFVIENYQYQSEFMQRMDREAQQRGLARGLARGKAEGKAESLRLVLAARGFTPSAAVAARVAECMDTDLLDRWIARAVTVSRIEDLFIGD